MAAAAAIPPAGAPVVPAPPVLPTSLAAWCNQNADPHDSASQLLQPFRDAPDLVDAIFTSLTTTTYPLPLLVNGEDGKPHVILMPFNENTLPGQPMGSKHGLVGDISRQGARTRKQQEKSNRTIQ